MTDVSLDAPVLASRASPAVGINVKISAAAATLLAVGTLALAATVSWRQGALYLVGGALGITLYHALFGFTSAWRIFISHRRGVGLRAQMIMLTAAVLLFYPSLARGTLPGARSPRCSNCRRHDAASRLAAGRSGPLAAHGGSDFARPWQLCDAVFGWPAVGHHFGLGVMGFEGHCGVGRRRRIVALLARRACRITPAKCILRHHLGYGFRNHDRRAAGSGASRQIPSGMENSAALIAGRARGRLAPRLRRAFGLRLQHRSLLQRRRFGQPAWLVLAGSGLPRQHSRHPAPSAG